MSEIKIEDKSNWLWTPAGMTKLKAALGKADITDQSQDHLLRWLKPLEAAYGQAVLELVKKDPKVGKLPTSELKEAAKKVAGAYITKFKLDKGTATITVNGSPFASKKLW